MYSMKSMYGKPTIQRNGRSVLNVCGDDWEFAHQVCELLNALSDEPQLLLTEYDWKWLRSLDRAFNTEVQHA